MRPENAVLTRFAYFIFPRPPDNFTHGVTDPQIENRVLSSGAFAPIAANYEAARERSRTLASGTFVPKAPGTSSYFPFDRPLRIEPGRRYLLDFTFPQGGDTHGTLEVSGRGFYRTYGLPDYGGPRSFGAGGVHQSLMPIWTTGAEPIDLAMRFYPDAISWPAPPPRARLLEYDPSLLPVVIKSLVPFRARVRSAAEGWLETPRMHQLGYIAMANGRPAELRRSPDGLAQIRVPRGESMVELAFKPPLGLRALFWVSLGAIAISAGAALAGAGRAARVFSG